MIVILCTSRSGSSLVAGVFKAHGCYLGDCGTFADYERFENLRLRNHLRHRQHENGWKFPQMVKDPGGSAELIKQLKLDLYKCGVEFWEILKPHASHVVKIYRDPEMAVKSVAGRHSGGNIKEAEYRVATRYQMLDAISGVTVNTDEVIAGDFTTLQAAVESCGLKWNEDKARKVVDPSKWHHRK